MFDLRQIANALGGVVSNGQVLAPGPGHSADDLSLSIKIVSDAPDGFLVHSFAEDDPIVCKDYVRQRLNLPAFQPNGQRRRKTSAEIENLLAAAIDVQERKPKGTLAATYRYVDHDKTLLYEVLKYTDPKRFVQRRPDGKKGWIWSLHDQRRVPYRWQYLRENPDATLFVCEGEKDADRVIEQLKYPATTVASGKWTQDCVEALRDRDCWIIADNDQAGEKKALDAANKLYGTAASIKIIRLPGLAEGEDISDWLDAGHTAEEFEEVCYQTPNWSPDDARGVETPTEENNVPVPAPAASENVPARSAAELNKASPVNLVFFDQLTEATPKSWLIKNVIARGEASSWIAQPGKGKSALLTDIAIHLASGRDWRGHRTKAKCGVIFFALERADLQRRRLIAYKLRDNLPSLPIAVMGQVIDLMNQKCVDVILGAIRQTEQHFGCDVGLVIIDTYPKGIAAGGGDESQAKDQNIVLANLRRVLDRAHIHIAGIGHTGKDESKGERGSNARLADVDLLVHISGDAIKTATVKKANDQPEDALTSFRLEPFDFGPDEDGDPFRTFILSQEILTVSHTERALSDRQRLAMEALTEATLSYGIDAPTTYQLPRGIKVVTAEHWKAELYRRKIVDPEGKNPRARFGELRTAMAAKHLIGVRDEHVWSALK